MPNGSTPRRELSSRATPWYRWGLAAFWLGFLAIGLAASRASGAPAAFAGFWLAVVALGAGASAWLVGPARRVWLEGDRLLVLSGGRLVGVPLAEVEAVADQRWTSPERVVLRLRRPGELGSRIVFLPRLRVGKLFSRHPVAQELEALLRGAAPADLPSGPRRRRPWWQPVLLVGAALVGLAGAALALVTHVLRSSEPYRQALAVASSHPALVERLGRPLEPGWLVLGELHTAGQTGDASLSFHLAGPRGEARVFAEARRDRRGWRTHGLRARVGDATLDLLAR